MGKKMPSGEVERGKGGGGSSTSYILFPPFGEVLNIGIARCPILLCNFFYIIKYGLN